MDLSCRKVRRVHISQTRPEMEPVYFLKGCLYGFDPNMLRDTEIIRIQRGIQGFDWLCPDDSGNEYEWCMTGAPQNGDIYGPERDMVEIKQTGVILVRVLG